MSALVRCFSFASVTTAPVAAGSSRYTTDSVGLMTQPYVARQALTVTDGAAQSTTGTLSDNSSVKLIHVQIQAGKTVAIECNPPGRTSEADIDSPYYSGEVNLNFGHNWTLSIREITVV